MPLRGEVNVAAVALEAIAAAEVLVHLALRERCRLAISNGDGVDAMGWDPGEKLLYIPAGRSGNVTIVHQDSADKYTTVATVETMAGTKTIAVDPTTHKAYALALEYGPPPANAPAPAAGGPPVRGPVIGAQFFTISH